MGRHPKPIETKIAEGKYRPSVHGPLDPHTFALLPALKDEPPDCLDQWGKDVWRRLYKELTAAGVLTSGEYGVFTLYCGALGRYEQASAMIAAEGIFRRPKAKKDAKSVSELAEANKPEPTEARLSVWYRVLTDAEKSVGRFAEKLGLTAVDRSRVVRTKRQGEGGQSAPLSRPKTALDLMTG